MRVRDSFADLDEQFQPFPSLQPLLIAVKSVIGTPGSTPSHSNGDDLCVADAEVAGIPRGAGSVDDVAVGDDEIEGGSCGLG